MDIDEWLRKEARAERTPGCSCASIAEEVGAQLHDSSSTWAHANVRLQKGEAKDAMIIRS